MAFNLKEIKKELPPGYKSWAEFFRFCQLRQDLNEYINNPDNLYGKIVLWPTLSRTIEDRTVEDYSVTIIELKLNLLEELLKVVPDYREAVGAIRGLRKYYSEAAISELEAVTILAKFCELQNPLSFNYKFEEQTFHK